MSPGEEKEKSPGPGPGTGPGMNRGIIAGIVVIVIAIVLFAVAVLGTSGSPSPGCDPRDGTCTPPAMTTPSPTTTPVVKTARPTVELYVMSFCPFGVQVEKVMKPVVALLANSTDFRVYYIANVPGTDLSTAKSLHGNAEAIEDARQLCILAHSPASYWEYLGAFDTQCYSLWMNQTQLGACQQNVTDQLGITETVKECMTGNEGYELLKADSAAVNGAGITSSPTIMINGQKYTGRRTSESIKQGICDHFDATPEACSTVLSTEVVAASGSC